MSTTQISAFGSHAELVELAFDLLGESSNPEFWLPSCDAALQSPDDAPLAEFCKSVWSDVGRSTRIASISSDVIERGLALGGSAPLWRESALRI